MLDRLCWGRRRLFDADLIDAFGSTLLDGGSGSISIVVSIWMTVPPMETICPSICPSSARPIESDTDENESTSEFCGRGGGS